MKKVTITIEDYLYEFYRKICANAGRSTEQVMADALFRLAGEMSLSAIKKKEEKQQKS